MLEVGLCGDLLGALLPEFPGVGFGPLLEVDLATRSKADVGLASGSKINFEERAETHPRELRQQGPQQIPAQANFEHRGRDQRDTPRA